MNPSTLKSALYTFALGSLIFYTTAHAVNGIEMSGEVSHWAMAFGVFFVAQFLVPKLLKFFTIPRNILTYWAFSALTTFASLYAMSLFLPGVTFTETVINSASFGFVSINEYTLSPDITMILASLYAGLLSALFYWLKKSEE